MLFTPQTLGGNEMGTAPPEPWILGGNKVLPPQGLRFWGGTTFSKSRSPPNVLVPPQDFGGEHPHFGGERLQNAQNPFPPKRLGGKISGKSAVPPQDGGELPPQASGIWGGTLPPQASEIWGGNTCFPPKFGGEKHLWSNNNHTCTILTQSPTPAARNQFLL